MKTGQILNIQDNKLSILKETVPSGNVMVDGLGVGDVGNIVLRDRKLLSESGLIIVVAAIERSTGTICSGPDIISRGFVYVRESEDLIESARKITKIKLDQCMEDGIRDWSALKNAVKDELKSYIYEKTKRNPVILPIFLEV
jgi:ribonuclease J